MSFNEYKGCLHIHLSPDLKKDFIDDIVSAAGDSRLDFMILTPHTPYRKKRADYFSIEGYRNGVLLLAGEEADEKSSLNHIIVYGVKNWFGKRNLETIVKDIEKKSLLAFAAHPDGSHMLFGLQTDHRWTKKHLLCSLTGLEIWSLLFDFASRTNPSNMIVRYFCFPQNLKGPSDSVMQLWDRVSMQKKFIGVAGLDIHPLRYGLKYLDIRKVFGYDFVFRTLRNHVLVEEKLTGRSETDVNIIVDAFKRGRVFFANDFLADSTGFFFGTQDKSKTMGDCIGMSENLLIQLPERADVRIKYPKETKFFEKIRNLVFKPEISGPCRVEVYYKERPWIFSNHLYIGQFAC
ncbi:MAG: hypothetical protein NC906_02420 [Candidatus Omnitrophica bacterium]|nr:hypothetical protein [Candidatus Omnitrophota bacterium]